MALSTSLRNAVALAIRGADRDLDALWRQVSTLSEARGALNDALPAIIDTYGIAAATLAAQWYDDLRAKNGIAGSFEAEPVDIAETGALALAGWALAQQALYGDEEEAGPFKLLTARARVHGGMIRRVKNFGRETVMAAAMADPRALGWQRQTDGNGCAFCELLAGRGAVYLTRTSATFASHDDCGCEAVPAWGGLPVPVRPYTPSQRNLSPATRAKNNARVREWIRTHDLPTTG